MINQFKTYLTCFFIVIVCAITLNACSKDTPGAQVELSYKMLSDKTWFLDYVQTINGSSIKTRTYLGQTTYFINFLKDYTTLDSDGLTGTYDIAVVNGKILVKVNAKTTGGNTVSYDYSVESMGSKVLVMSYNTNGVVNKFYYSAK